VITDILTADKKATRAKLIKQMIKVAQHCYELRNYNTVMEILSALETPSISRLKEGAKRWEFGSRFDSVVCCLCYFTSS
jgi:hypothetical protein